MEFDNERVLKLIFPDGVPEHLQGREELLKQIYTLGLYKLDQIKKEEVRLTDETKSIVEQTQDLAISNYKTFIQTSECSRKIFKDFKETEQKVDSLIAKLPNLNEKCTNFITTSSAINTSRRLNSLTLRRNTQILEILELPQLMDTCICEGKYEEALELAAHVQRMAAKHGDIPVINNILQAIGGLWHTMLLRLLAQLGTDLQLPNCLQVVGYLRRMQAFSTPELKLKFLQARDAWFCGLLANIPTEDPQVHITRTIEVSRVNLFNIITQYKATFAEHEHSESLSISHDTGNIFYTWLNEKIHNFLDTLKADLQQGVTSLDTVLGQCMYFGLSFSRVSADFRGLMVPIFIEVIVQNFANAIQKVTKQYEIDMENYTLINKIAPSAIGNIAKSKQNDPTNLSPPETLLNFQPLALYCNGVLSALNELKHCSPVAVVSSVTECIEVSLQRVTDINLNFYRLEQQALGIKEHDNFIKFCCSFAFDLIPHLQRCIHHIFPVNVLTTHLGINAMTLQKQGISYLQKEKILEPLKHLLPSKIESITKEIAEIKVVTIDEEAKGAE